MLKIQMKCIDKFILSLMCACILGCLVFQAKLQDILSFILRTYKQRTHIVKDSAVGNYINLLVSINVLAWFVVQRLRQKRIEREKMNRQKLHSLARMEELEKAYEALLSHQNVTFDVSDDSEDIMWTARN